MGLGLNQKKRRMIFFDIFLFIKVHYERGRSFFSLYRARRETLATFTTLKRTPVDRNSQIEDQLRQSLAIVGLIVVNHATNLICK